MPYVITDGQFYIRKDISGKYVPIRNAVLGDQYDTKIQAEKILQNSIAKKYRQGMRVELLEGGKEEPPPLQAVKNSKEIPVQTSAVVEQWLTRMKELNGLMADAVKRKQVLDRELLIVDQQLCDMMHYIEFSSLNASDGYKAYKATRELRLKRREVKDELLIVDTITRGNVMDTVIDELRGKLYRRTYKPRQLTDIFKERTDDGK